ncbi:conserved hypothetical protein [Hyella patelloides LEGE 07179]|uniref:Sulfotransferase domain-containing protein n=1 Tax=Hyella patelloides LEGE 07179 TaxID=945734 RepID=A0A563VMP1_9CYAN|nr:hypothetical protein [Hyella patelloides]VEP12699.1 conserved hypothetical protein [Hyella patelloides LEGE 07179]
MKKTYIHIGIPKTATTYLQNQIFPHIKSAYYVGRPYTQENHAFNLLQYADNTLFKPIKFANELDKINKLASDKEYILISDEKFFGLTTCNFINRSLIAERLSSAMPNAEILIFIRNQEDFILSMYKQHVKMGMVDRLLDKSYVYSKGSGFDLDKWQSGVRSFDLKNRFISHQSFFNIENLRFNEIIAYYEKMFPKVHVFLYEQFKYDPESIYKRLSQIFSFNVVRIANNVNTEGLVNYSLSLERLKEFRTRNLLSKFVKNKKILKIISKITVLRKESQNNLARDYVNNLMKNNDIYENNQLLDSRMNLGMSKHSKKYFGQ